MENPAMTPDANRTPEEIEQEMLQTRGAITEKVAALENQVVGTVQSAADTLTGTVESVKDLLSTAPTAVSDTVKQAAEAVKQTFDISGHVRANPLAAVGVSLLVGGVVGYLLGGGRRSGGQAESASAPLSSVSTAYTPPARTPTSPPSVPGVFDELLALIGRKVREVAETAIDAAAAAINNSVREEVPKLVDSAKELAAERLSESPNGGQRSRADHAVS